MYDSIKKHNWDFKQGKTINYNNLNPYKKNKIVRKNCLFNQKSGVKFYVPTVFNDTVLKINFQFINISTDKLYFDNKYTYIYLII